MQKIKLLFRKTNLLPEPVFCGAFSNDTPSGQVLSTAADNKIKDYISNFINQFPEFTDQPEFSSGGKKTLVEWDIVETELH